MDDNALLELMHGVFINQKTQTNEEFTFDEFYQVITNYYNRNASSIWPSRPLRLDDNE